MRSALRRGYFFLAVVFREAGFAAALALVVFDPAVDEDFFAAGFATPARVAADLPASFAAVPAAFAAFLTPVTAPFAADFASSAAPAAFFP